MNASIAVLSCCVVAGSDDDDEVAAVAVARGMAYDVHAVAPHAGRCAPPPPVAKVCVVGTTLFGPHANVGKRSF